MSPTSASPRIGAIDENYCFAEWRSVYIDIWRQHTLLDGVRVFGKQLADFAREHREGFALLTIVEADAAVPDSTSREAVAALMRTHGKAIKSSALVFEGSGFRAAAIRGVVTGMAMLARPSFPHRVFPDTRSSARWLLEALGQAAPELTLDPDELLDAVNDLRTQMRIQSVPATARSVG